MISDKTTQEAKDALKKIHDISDEENWPKFENDDERFGYALAMNNVNVAMLDFLYKVMKGLKEGLIETEH